VTVEGLDPASAQGDRAAQRLFRPENLACVDVRDVPDLMPVLAAVMAAGVAMPAHAMMSPRLAMGE